MDTITSLLRTITIRQLVVSLQSKGVMDTITSHHLEDSTLYGCLCACAIFSARFLVPQRKKPYFMCLGLTHSIYHHVLEIITLETN